MEALFLNDFNVAAIRGYNCSAANHPLFVGTRQPGWGMLNIIYGVFIMTAYTLCIIVMFRKKHRKHACFKIMIYLGIGDVLCIMINSSITGMLLIYGAVYCSAPTFLYFCGSFAVGLWCNSCITCVVLALNRLFDLTKKELFNKLFGGRRVFMWLSLCFLYMMYFIIFTKPVVFDANLGSWFFDPKIFPEMSGEFHNYSHALNNLAIVLLLLLIYAIYICLLSKKYKEHQQRFSVATNPVSLQCLLVCVAHSLASLVYVYMNFFPTPEAFTYLGQVSWQISHGMPCVIYILINKSMRRDVELFMQGKLKWSSKKKNKSGKVHPNGATVSQQANESETTPDNDEETSE